MNTSCSTPLSTRAARASLVLALIRISVPIGRSDPFRLEPAGHARRAQHLRRLVKRQTHHARVAAAQCGDEDGTVSLDRITAGLVAALSRGPVIPRLLARDLAEGDLAAAQAR